jgi:lipid-A-disaccharide synthase-like uncharacterized protein
MNYRRSTRNLLQSLALFAVSATIVPLLWWLSMPPGLMILAVVMMVAAAVTVGCAVVAKLFGAEFDALKLDLRGVDLGVIDPP